MYIDAHAHLDKYDSHLPEVIQEIEDHEIFTVSVSMDPEAYAKSRHVEEQTNWVLSTFGVHPWNAPAFHSQLDAFQPLIDTSPLLGEIGLDDHFIREPENHGLPARRVSVLRQARYRSEKDTEHPLQGSGADSD